MLMKNRLKDIIQFIDSTADEHMGAFSSQSAFFLFLSFFPMINLLAVLPTFLPISQDQVMDLIYYVVPSQFEGYISGLVKDMYKHGAGSITIFSVAIAVWSAAKGIMAIRNGLNEVYRSRENRNYLFIRGVSALYTIIFIIVIIVLVVLNMFGTQIAMYIIDKFPDYVDVTFLVYNLKSVATFILLFILFELMYTLVPTRKTRMKEQLPGAIFSALSWILVTKLFSMYIDYYASKSYMYGSITTIIMIMFWLQIVIYLLFVGAQINEYLHSRREREKEYELSVYTEDTDEVWENDAIKDELSDGTGDINGDIEDKINEDEISDDIKDDIVDDEIDEINDDIKDEMMDIKTEEKNE